METAANGSQISWKIFLKFWKLLNFRNANLSTKNSRNSGRNWKKTSGKNWFENWGIPCEVVLFSEVFENAVPFATGSWRIIKPDILVQRKAPELTDWNIVKDLQFFLLCLVYLPVDCLSCKYQSTTNTYYCTVLCLGLQSWLV